MCVVEAVVWKRGREVESDLTGRNVAGEGILVRGQLEPHFDCARFDRVAGIH